MVGNQAAKLRAKIVVGSLGNHPTLEGIDDVEIVQGHILILWKGVKASDGNGNDITHQIKILKNTVNTEEVGSYEVIYSITNSQGNNIQRTRKVEVIKNESEKKK
ncbi:MAG: immunoglobulin-like domain-containing protein [Faecalibacillus faecis]